MQFPVPFIFSIMFNLSLVMSLTVFICGQSLHFPQGVTLEWSGWFAISFFKRWSERDLFFRLVAVGFCLKIFDSLGSLEIKWKLCFKIDGIALSLGCHVLTNVVCGSLFSRIRSRNNSFLSIFATCFIVFFNSFSWKPRSINCLHKISLFNR